MNVVLINRIRFPKYILPDKWACSWEILGDENTYINITGLNLIFWKGHHFWSYSSKAKGLVSIWNCCWLFVLLNFQSTKLYLGCFYCENTKHKNKINLFICLFKVSTWSWHISNTELFFFSFWHHCQQIKNPGKSQIVNFWPQPQCSSSLAHSSYPLCAPSHSHKIILHMQVVLNAYKNRFQHDSTNRQLQLTATHRHSYSCNSTELVFRFMEILSHSLIITMKVE